MTEERGCVGLWKGGYRRFPGSLVVNPGKEMHDPSRDEYIFVDSQYDNTATPPVDSHLPSLNARRLSNVKLE